MLDPDTGSDHSAIRLRITLPTKPKTKNCNLTNIIPKITWNERTRTQMEHKLNSTTTIDEVTKLENKVDSEDNNIDEIITHLVNLITPNDTSKRKKSAPIKKKRATKKWYDASCHEVSKRLKNCAKLLAASPNVPHLRGSFCKTRKEYKKLLKLKKREWKNDMISRLENLEHDNPKEYSTGK